MARQKKQRSTTGTRKTSVSSQVETVEKLNIPWPTTRCDLKTAVRLVAQHADRPFTLGEAVTEIRKNARVRNPDPQDHIESLLDETDDVAYLPAQARYIPGRVLFRDAAFYIAPTEPELNDGVLFPGHRFYPFISMRVAPNEAALSTEDGTAVEKRRLVRPMSDLMIYHSLLAMGDILTLCTPVDGAFPDTSEGMPATLMEIDAYDLSAFYQTHGFSKKDLMLVRVLDYDTGRLQISHANAQTRLDLQRETVERDKALENHLVELMDILGPELPLHMLRDAYAHLCEEGIDLSKPASAFGQFLSKSKRIALAGYIGRPCLVPHGEDPMEYYGAFPNMFVYDGRCETMEDLFLKGDLSLDMPYVRAVILDDMDHDGGGKDTVIERIFRGRSVLPWDDADWAFFHEEFDRLQDEIRARHQELSPHQKVRTLRRLILEQCDKHLAFLRQMDQHAMLPSDLPFQEFTAMAGLDGLYSQFLQFLETRLGRRELQMMEDQMEVVQIQSEALYENFEKAIKTKKDDWEAEDWEEEDWEEAAEEIEGPVRTYALKVKFAYDKRIWRTIEITEQQTLHHLHLAIQEAIEWDADHLYSFFMSNRAWDADSEISSPYGESEAKADQIRIADLMLKPKQKFLYLFDYGDGHEFEVEVLNIRSDAPGDVYPKLVASKGKAPEQYPDWE